MFNQHPWGSFLKCWGWVLLGVVAMWGPTLAWAQDHILEKSYWTDTTGAASFEEARSASYASYNGVLSKGFGREVQWVKLKIDGMASNADDKVVLRIRPVFLDQITLFDPLEFHLGKPTRITGDRSPFTATE